MDFYLQRVLRAIESATRGMNIEQMRTHPPGKWSTAEILEHLSRTYSGTVQGLQRVLDAGRPAARRPTLGDRVFTALVVELGDFPSGRPAPESTRPRGVSAEGILQDIRKHVDAMDR